jgi:hypothetical protein
MNIRKSRTKELLAAAALLAFGGLVSACTEDSPCSANESFNGGYCYPSDAALPPAPADASVGEVVTMTLICDGGASAAFCQLCNTTAECPAPMQLCAKDPTSSAPGFCTMFACDQNPDICPADWTCMDLRPRLAAYICAPSS